MKKINVYFAVLAMFVFYLPSCEMFCEEGSGNVTSEKRDVSAFNKLEAGGIASVIIKKSEKRSVKIETDDNLQELIETKVKDGVLRISNDGCVKNVTRLDITIHTPELTGIELSGAAVIKGKGTFSSDDLVIETSGSGNIELDINVDKLEIEIDGSGEVDLKGNVNNGDIEITGAGELSAYKLIINEAEVEVSGSGKCKVNVSKTLDAEVTGTGEIIYKGNPPNMNTKVTGLGKIKAK